MIDLTPIVNALITLAALLITTFLIPWIRSKVAAEKLMEIERWATIAIEAAEMIYNKSGMGEVKKKYVNDFLAAKGYQLDQNAVDNLIESIVYEMNEAKDVK